jgi:hypothetical protein
MPSLGWPGSEGGVMADEPFLITPPPGLLPPPRESQPEPAPVSTGSETVRTGQVGIPVRPPPATVVAPTAPLVPHVTPPEPAPAPREPGPWFVRLADGVEHELGPAGLVLGRNPVAPAAAAGAAPVRIDDPAKSVSKTHALLVPEGSALRVLDLRSTNGVAVTPPTGEAIAVPVDGLLAAEGAIVALGDYTLAVARR